MWEHAFYVAGDDDGVLHVPAAVAAPLTGADAPLEIGAAVCWELMRTQTVHRLRGRVDLALTGSGWWSIPPWPPRALTARLERRNAATARLAAASFARYIGAPVAHAAHAGAITGGMPWLPGGYRGRLEGATLITDAAGTVLAELDPHGGEGVAIADVTPGRRPPSARPPARFWLHRRGALPAVAWNYQRLHGRRWYARHVAAPGAPREPGLGPGAVARAGGRPQ